MKKSLYLSYDGLLESLGSSQIIPYVKDLAGRGINFVILSFDKKACFDSQRAEILRKQLKELGIEWVSLRYHKKPQVLSTLFDIITGFIKSSAIIKKDKVNIVHARGYVTGFIGYYLKKIYGVKFIFDMRGFWADEKAEAGHWKKNGAIYRIAKYFERLFVINADEVVIITKAALPAIEQQRHSKEGISIVPCCVDTSVFGLSDQAEDRRFRLEGKFVFAHIGSLEAWYMQEEMLAFFKVAQRFITNAHFLVLSHSSKEGFLRLIRQGGLRDDDFTLEYADFKIMPQYLAGVDAGLIFLGLSFSKVGCFPTKFSEFMSCGVPVVTSANIGDTQDLVENNRTGVIINNFNEREYERAVKELLVLKQDKDLRRRCRDLALRELSLNVGSEKYAAIYSRM